MGLEPDDLKGRFQPEPFYDSMILIKWLLLKMLITVKILWIEKVLHYLQNMTTKEKGSWL